METSTRPSGAESGRSDRPDHPPTGVLLLNLGGPEALSDVEPFLVRLFSDRDIIELPFGRRLQPVLARVIAKARGPSVRRNYALIGGGSPQLHLTRRQAAALERRLNHSGGPPERPSLPGRGPAEAARRFRVFIAMRYARPSAEDALAEMRTAGVRRIVTLPLFPHWSRATTGSSERELERILNTPGWRTQSFEISGIPQYAGDALYLDAFADTVRRALDAFPVAVRNQVVILFSAHGLPRRLVDAGDPYVEHVEATRAGLLARLQLPHRHVLGYQSRTGPVRWIGPGTEELIEELAAEGVRALLVVPLSFVSDHIETLYEIDLLFAAAARRAGIVHYRRPAALNTHPLFIEALARLVEHHLATGVTTRWTGGAAG
jgi:protoporphyrin/coproporphyrin ferrochelatase